MEPNLLMSRTFLILGGMLVVTTITSRFNKAYETSLEAVFTIGGTFLFLFMVMIYADSYPLNLVMVAIFSGFFRSILSGEGDMKFPMMVAGLGTVLNIILDPIFIFELDSFGGIGFGLGIAGAAMATVISQVVVFLIFGVQIQVFLRVC